MADMAIHKPTNKLFCYISSELKSQCFNDFFALLIGMLITTMIFSLCTVRDFSFASVFTTLINREHVSKCSLLFTISVYSSDSVTGLKSIWKGFAWI